MSIDLVDPTKLVLWCHHGKRENAKCWMTVSCVFLWLAIGFKSFKNLCSTTWYRRVEREGFCEHWAQGLVPRKKNHVIARQCPWKWRMPLISSISTESEPDKDGWLQHNRLQQEVKVWKKSKLLVPGNPSSCAVQKWAFSKKMHPRQYASLLHQIKATH